MRLRAPAVWPALLRRVLPAARDALSVPAAKMRKRGTRQGRGRPARVVDDALRDLCAQAAPVAQLEGPWRSARPAQARPGSPGAAAARFLLLAARAVVSDTAPPCVPPSACRQTAGLLALALVALVQLHACCAQESVMDKNGDGVVTPDEFVEHAAAQEACDGGACAADEATHAKLRESAEEEAAGEMPTVTPEQIAAMQADIAAQLASGKSVKMTTENSPAVLSGSHNLMIKFSTSW